MKTCPICCQERMLDEFYRCPKAKDGLRYHCKACEKILQRKYRKTKKGKVAIRRYFQSEKGKYAHKRFCMRHPKRIQAKNAVTHAVETGKIPHIKTRRCYFCYEKAQEYHHYKGYERRFWLDVIPVCIKCHIRLRRKIAI